MSTPCGCEGAAAASPCTQQAFETASVPFEAPAMAPTSLSDADFNLVACWDCGGLPEAVGPAIILAIFLLPIVIAVNRRVTGKILIPRLDLLSNLKTQTSYLIPHASYLVPHTSPLVPLPCTMLSG